MTYQAPNFMTVLVQEESLGAMQEVMRNWTPRGEILNSTSLKSSIVFQTILNQVSLSGVNLSHSIGTSKIKELNELKWIVGDENEL